MKRLAVEIIEDREQVETTDSPTPDIDFVHRIIGISIHRYSFSELHKDALICPSAITPR